MSSFCLSMGVNVKTRIKLGQSVKIYLIFFITPIKPLFYKALVISKITAKARGLCIVEDIRQATRASH